MTNKYYQYDNLKFWYPESWTEKVSRVNEIVQWLGERSRVDVDNSGYTVPDWDEETKKRCFQGKTLSYLDPKVMNYWKDKGLHLQTLDMTIHWLAAVPTKAMELKKEGEKFKTLVVMLAVDYNDYFWAMKITEQFRKYNEMAIKEDTIIIYIVSNNGPDIERTYLNVIQEAATLFPCDPDNLYLDLSVVFANGATLNDIPGLKLKKNGEFLADLNDVVEKFSELQLPAMNLYGNWENGSSLGRDLVMGEKYVASHFDRERMLFSETGKKMAEWMEFEHRFDTVYDEGVKEHFEKLGISFEIGEYKGERYLTLTPMAVKDYPEEHLPVVLTLQEVYRGNEHLAVTALSYISGLIPLVSAGQCMLLFFVLEDPDSNDMIMDILDEVKETHPVDMTRVYVTGHSHDGRFSLELGRRNWKRIAAVATLGNFNGLEEVRVLGDEHAGVSDEKMYDLSKKDLPLVNLCGCCEHGGKLPLNRPASECGLKPGQEMGRTLRLDDRIESWKRRLIAWNCPPKTDEEILAARDSDDVVERELGAPFDKTAVVYGDGFDHYIGDVKNNNGKYHLRMVGLQNMPHIPTPFMMECAWSFMKRFARDLETGEIIELY